MRILNAAFAEFAEKGYRQASTNEIVNQAGIGKGMLFHYFGSKKKLYFYLIDYGIEFMLAEYVRQLNQGTSDFIERYWHAAETKMKAYSKNPHILNFLGNIVLNNEVELPQDLHSRLLSAQRKGYEQLFTGIDTSMIRQDLDRDKAIKLIQWSIDGYSNDLMSRLKGESLARVDMDPYWDEFYQYLRVLKTAFYKQGGLSDDGAEDE